MHNLYALRIANLDESVSRPRKHLWQSNRAKSHDIRAYETLERSLEFRKVKSISVMPVMFASGESGRSFFVLEEEHLIYHTVELNGAHVVEALANCLSRGTAINTRRDVSAKDRKKFLH